MTHTKVKDHECDICKKKFSLKCHLVAHFRIHLGEKPYGCAKCKNWFTHISTRNQHLRAVHLVEHLRIHLGEKPFGCSKSETWFIQSSARDYHLRIHHTDFSKKQQAELKCGIPRTIVYDYLNFIDHF